MAAVAGKGMKHGRMEKAVELARKVGKPLTFFAAMGFILVGLLPVIYGITPDDASLLIALPAILVAIAIPIDIVCVLVWAKAKITQNPHAFDDE